MHTPEHFWKFLLSPRPTFIPAVLMVVLPLPLGVLSHLQVKVPGCVVWVSNPPSPQGPASSLGLGCCHF